MITTSSQWDSISKFPGKLVVIAKLFYGAAGANDYIPLGSDDVRIGSDNFLGILKLVPRSVQKVDIKSHSYSIGSMSLSIDNLDYEPGQRFSDLFESLGAGADLGFENRKAEIRLWLPGITSFANCFPLMEKGLIRDTPHGRTSSTFVIEDGTELFDEEISSIVAEADATSGFVMPENSLGKLRQVNYGNNQFTVNGNSQNGISTADWQNTRNNKLIPMINLGGNNWLIAGHQMESVVAASGDAIWGFDSNLNRYVELIDWTLVQNTAAGAIISKDDINYYDYRAPASLGALKEWLNDANLIDGDITTNTNVELADEAAPQTKKIDINFPDNDIPTGDIDANSINLFIKGNGNWIQGAGSDFHLRVEDAGAALIAEFLGNGQGAGETQYTTTNFFREAGGLLVADLEAVKLVAESEAGLGAPGEATVYEIYMRVKYENTDNLDLYFGAQGREYDTWINGRGVGEGFTEAHADDDDAGDLIENFAGAIESVIRDEMSLATADIDEDSFNIASNDVSSLIVCSNTIADIKPVELIREMATNCRSFIWWLTNGTFKMKTLLDTYAASDRVIDFNDIKDLRFPRTKPVDLRTAVQVQYDWNGSEYLSITPLVQDTTAQTKYNVTQSQSKMTFQARHIHDRATAILLGGYLLAFWKQPHNIAVGTLGKENLDLDIGDIIEFTNMAYKVRGEDITINNTRAGQTIYKYWWIIYADRGPDIKFNAIQLHDLS